MAPGFGALATEITCGPAPDHADGRGGGKCSFCSPALALRLGEAAITNTLNPGDRVLNGAPWAFFPVLWAQMAEGAEGWMWKLIDVALWGRGHVRSKEIEPPFWVVPTKRIASRPMFGHA